MPETIAAGILSLLPTGVAVTIGGYLPAALSLAGSALLQVGIAKLTARDFTPERQRFELFQPRSRAVKRFVYGYYRAPATPVRRWSAGEKLYGLYILNSRPSDCGNMTVLFDSRPSEIAEGDAFDFAGGGARLTITEDFPELTGDDRPRVWVGRGDQTAPPDDVLAALPDDLLATDAFTGLTVLWVELTAGDNENLRDRWPNGTRTEIEVEARWSRVWDPRDPAQDPDDPDTWLWSDNQALCTLDAALRNPIRQRPRFLVGLDSFIAGADLADQDVPLKNGGTVTRYTANGILTWDGSELVDQIAPLADAGAGELVQIGGLLSYALPVASAPVYTVTDILDDGELDFSRLAAGSSLPVAVRASYVAPDRGWQSAELPALALGIGSSQTLEDGVAELPLQFVTEPTQAMRVQQITAKRLAAQKTVACVLPPDAIDIVPGAVVDWAVPGVSRCNGRWRVRSVNPNAWLTENKGVAMKCPVQLVQEPINLDAWNPATDEFDLATEDYVPPARLRDPVENLSATTGPGVALGDVARIRFSFDTVAGSPVGYEWQWREVGGEYAEGGSINADIQDASGRGFAYLVPVVAGTEYQIRVRVIYLFGVSDWVDVTITAQGPAYELDPPSDGQATGGAGQIELSFLTPNNVDFQAIEFWASGTDDVATATQLGAAIASAANTVQTVIETGLGAAETRYYWARSRGPQGSVSAYSASVSATTDA